MLEKMTPTSLIRKKILDLVFDSKEGHLASCFSIVEILYAVFEHMKSLGEIKTENIILSKGHSSYAYYAILSYYNLLSNQEISSVGDKGSKLYGHLPFIKNDKRFQFGSGSLGHGLPYAIGLAKAKELNGLNDTIYCIVGDGEANEGTFWESLLICSKFKNLNLRIIIDSNGSSERAIPINKILNNLNFTFENLIFSHCNGHNIFEIKENLNKQNSKINIIICKTIKGYPIKFMENNPIWHHKVPNEDDKNRIINFLLKNS